MAPPSTGSSSAPANVAPIATMPLSSKIPNEIWFDIVDLVRVGSAKPELPVNTTELMNVRLINHGTAYYTKRYLFNSTVLSADAKSFENVSHVTNENGNYVETVYISPLRQDLIDQAEYNRRVRVSFGKRPNPEWAAHSKIGFANYCSEMENSNEILRERELGFRLIRALNALLPRVPRIVIRASRYIPKYDKERLDKVRMSYSLFYVSSHC